MGVASLDRLWSSVWPPATFHVGPGQSAPPAAIVKPFNRSLRFIDSPQVTCKLVFVTQTLFRPVKMLRRAIEVVAKNPFPYQTNRIVEPELFDPTNYQRRANRESLFVIA
jgi:hypothetical protein